MRLSLSLLLCLLVSLLRAQAPVANFTANVVTGCSPLGVSFTDKSTGSPVSWNWDFGNGQLSNQQNPSVSFAPGTYSVTLVVRNASGINSTTKTNYIVSNPSPSASFDADKYLSCLPGSIQFKDLSIPNAGTINKWSWDFGDGTPASNQQNPVHNYTAAGYYDIYLSVTSTTGCSSAASRARFIRIVNGVKADFAVVGPSSCTAPFSVVLNNLTSGPGTLTYNWDLGNSTTSTQTSPPSTYAAAGNYTVKLAAVSNFGCADTITKVIPITGSTTSFQTVGNKDTVCLGSPVSFQNNASPAPTKIVWDFGDGSPAFTGPTPPAKTYAAAGIYKVTMTATYPNCSSTAIKNITVADKPTVDFFSTNSNSFCKAPAAVVFQNLSPDYVSANWDFGDGGTSTAITPSVTHTYTTGDKNFTVTLNIKNSLGCSNSTTKTNFVNVLSPNVSLQNLPLGLCKDQTFFPGFTSGNVDGIASYKWDFGDGGTSTAANPSHSYAAFGTYTVKLSITTNGGCTVSDSKGPIVVGPPPSPVDFDKIPTTKDCRSVPVQFTNLSGGAPLTTYVWDFGDGGKSTDVNPIHKFVKDTGFFSIKLVASLNGCADSTVKTDFVHIEPPIANFGYKIQDCANRYTIIFTDSSLVNPALGAPSYLWKFGDPANNTDVTQNPTFTFPAGPASYNTQLIVTNGFCTDTINRPVVLINQKAAFTVRNPAVYCRNEDISFGTTNDGSLISSFEWILDGAAPVLGHGTFTTQFAAAGAHTIRLLITDIYGCQDTSAPVSFTVTGPSALFGVQNNGGCKNSVINFSDSSKPSAGGILTKWTFDFGDGSPSKLFTAGPFTHKFANTGTYLVKMTVVDNVSIGCQDTLTVPVTITRPATAFSAAKTVFCPGVPLQFTDSSFGGGLTYAWDFGDGTSSNVQNPLHQYAGQDSIYSVKLAIKDSVGCTDSLVRNGYISVRTPKALYAVKDTATLCPPLETKFTFLGKDVDSFYWDFGDGGLSTLAKPNHFYNNYGQYTAKLYVTGYGGCIDSAGINISVTNAATAVQLNYTPNPAQACNNLTVNFNITPPYATKFTFYYGDGTADSSQNNSISHFYNLPNVYSPYLYLEDSVGCKLVIGGRGNVNVQGAVPLFGADKKKFCDSGSVYFTDFSQDGTDNIVTRTWDFNDGSAPVVLPKDAQHTYTKPGLYVPSLLVKTASGCTQTFTDTVRVLATPQPIINSAAGVCNDSSLNFSGSLLIPPDTAISWNWDFGGGKTSVLQDVSVHFPDTGVHHIALHAANSLGCKGDTSKDIIVYPLPAIKVVGDTTAVSGGVGITLPVSYSQNTVSYEWTPEANLSCTDCANPFANPKFTTTYHVKVIDDKSCTSSRDITLVVTCNNKNFFIPNTFSPNNDGSNDRFYPRGTGLNLIQALRIFNRWGELVFEKRNFPANDPSSGWDGTFRGKAASTDTYIYMIDIICENANVITYKGNITLIR